jgi:hypothetical protein
MDALAVPVGGLGTALIYMTHCFHRLIFFFAAHTPAFMRQFFIDKTDFWLLMVAVICYSIYFLKKKSKFLFLASGLLCILICSFIIQDVRVLNQKRIVVYNSAPIGLIDYFSGKKHESIALPDSALDAKAYRYHLLPARLGFRAMREAPELQDKHVWHIRNKTILYLNKNFRPKEKAIFPADYLILSANCAYKPLFWQRVFLPEEIILDGSFPRWKAKKWEADLTALGIAVHNVAREGAWIFPNN